MKEEEEKNSLIQAVGTVLRNRLQQRQKKCENLCQFYIFFVVVFGVLQKQCGHRQKFFVLPAFIFYSNTIKFSTDAKTLRVQLLPTPPTHSHTHTVFCEHWEIQKQGVLWCKCWMLLLTFFFTAEALISGVEQHSKNESAEKTAAFWARSKSNFQPLRTSRRPLNVPWCLTIQVSQSKRLPC